MKKILTLITILILSLVNVTAIDYLLTSGDSLFVRGINFEQSPTNASNYRANIKVDLAYKDYANPLNRYQSVIEYQWNNWWNPYIDWQSFGVGTMGATYNASNGEMYSLNLLNYYYEIPDITGSDCKDGYEIIQNTRVPCTQVPNIRQGYYGLPFYIQQIEFYCDKDDKTKGYLLIKPSSTYKDTYDLTRPSYAGINGPSITTELGTVPLGFGVIGKMVRTPSLTNQRCTNMETTTNAQLNMILRPNPYYRHENPETTGSDSWSYSDIIDLGTTLSNKDDLQTSMNIVFNYSGNWWNYTIDNNQSLLEAGIIGGGDYDLDCVVDPTIYRILPTYLQNIITGAFAINLNNFNEKKKYSELPAELKPLVNTGQGVVCSYGQSPFVGGYISNNDVIGKGSIVDEMALYRQEQIAVQLDVLDKKLETKSFVAHTVIPFFTFVIILIFYIFEIAVIGFAFFGLIPIMFKQFLKGVKESFDLSEIKRVRRK